MLTLAAYLHRLDPFAIRFTENFGIRWYGLAYAAGFVCAYLVAHRLARTRRIRMTPAQVGDFIMYGVVGVLAGGRFGYVLFYNLPALWTFTSDPPFWEALAINRGGMSSHGGIVGSIAATLLFCRRHRLNPFEALDLAALVVPFGLFFGRLANFVNGELRGVPANPGFPLAVKFPQEMIDDWTLADWRGAEAIAKYFGLSSAQWQSLLDGVLQRDPSRLAEFRQFKEGLLEAVQAGNTQAIAAVEPRLTPVHPSQLYQAVAEGIVLGAILWFVFLVLRPRRPGVIGACFVFFYGLLRIVTEIWRVPDEGIGRTMGLSRGQWLSAVMVLVGAFFLWWTNRKSRPAREVIEGGA